MPVTISYCEDGTSVSDFNVEHYVDVILHLGDATPRSRRNIKISSGTVINCINLRICEGKIQHDAVEFEYNGQILKMNKQGQIKNWPIGFADFARLQRRMIEAFCNLSI